MQEGCTALGATATDAGLTGLVGAITTAAPVLEVSHYTSNGTPANVRVRMTDLSAAGSANSIAVDSGSIQL